MKTLHCLKLVYNKNYFNLAKIFVLRLFKIAANQTASDLNRGLSENFWLLRIVNYEKFTEECVIQDQKRQFMEWKHNDK